MAYGIVDREYGMRLATAESDGPIWMVNLMRYRERADYGGGDDGGLTGREADDRYAPLDVLADIGAEVVFVADVEAQPVGEPRWDRVGIVRYPTRRSFVEMQSRDDFRERHVHKAAGMDTTIVMGCLPAPTPRASGDDAAVVVLRVLPVADTRVPAGARPLAWFDVEGTILGDGRRWAQVRFDAVPGAETAAVPGDDGYALILRPTLDRLAAST